MLEFVKDNWQYFFFAMFPLVLLRLWFKGPRAELKRHLAGKTIIITGANAGIGFETAKTLHSQGATVIFACRSEERALKAIKDGIAKGKDRAIFMKLDLSDSQSIFDFAAEFKRRYGAIDILFNNAGQMKDGYFETKDHMEYTVGSMFVGHFMLTALLMDCFNPEARILSAYSHVGDFYHPSYDYFEHDLEFTKPKESYSIIKQYTIGKLGLATFTLFLRDYIKKYRKDIKVAIEHPGWVHTMAQYKIGLTFKVIMLYIINIPLLLLVFKNQFDGAQASIQACNEDYDKLKDCGYFYDTKEYAIQQSIDNPENVARYMGYAKRLIINKVENRPKELDTFLSEIREL